MVTEVCSKEASGKEGFIRIVCGVLFALIIFDLPAVHYTAEHRVLLEALLLPSPSFPHGLTVGLLFLCAPSLPFEGSFPSIHPLTVDMFSTLLHPHVVFIVGFQLFSL